MILKMCLCQDKLLECKVCFVGTNCNLKNALPGPVVVIQRMLCQDKLCIIQR